MKKERRRYTREFKISIIRELEVTDINQLWVANITYIQLLKEFIFLAAIIDIFSRRCIGWELSRYIDTQLTLNVLHKALKTSGANDLSGLIHHI